MLQFLQGLLGNKQQQNASQFGQNLGLQQQELGQQGQQFTQNLGERSNEFNQNIALQKQIQDQANALAREQQQQAEQAQQFNQGFQNRMNVTPGSTLWNQMQEFGNPNSVLNTLTKSMIDSRSAGASKAPFVSFTPAGPEWRIS